ncbi:DUF6056 family protein [Paenibacillus sp. JNUCC31]|uniref:DUF6056 family protein n=1 Tax=Paenibacillus sp. JNUCC-31 TaxID=2777983 RepID=UPI003A4C6E58
MCCLFWLFCWVLTFLHRSFSEWKKENVYFGILFMFVGCMSFFIMIASPIFLIRASYGERCYLN